MTPKGMGAKIFNGYPWAGQNVSERIIGWEKL